MKKLLSPSDKSINKGNAFRSSVMTSIIMLICCAVCFTGATWAWFTISAAVRTGEINTANYETELVVTDQDGNVIEPVDGKYDLSPNVRYTATITAPGTASTGFAAFSVEGIEYHSVQIAPGESISFDILGYSPLETGEANWGTSSSQNPVFDGDPRFIKSAVKLVPKDESSTAMIERNGVVETYNTDLEVSPYGVTEIIEPNEDVYDSEDFEKYYVYGLKDNISEEEIADYVKVTGDGRMEITLNEKGKASTGAVINVIDNNTGAVVEHFYIIVFGDIDGDADISAQDNSRVNRETRIKDWSNTANDNYKAYLVKAADLDLDGDISAQDSARITSTTRNVISIDQKTGKAS